MSGLEDAAPLGQESPARAVWQGFFLRWVLRRPRLRKGIPARGMCRSRLPFGLAFLRAEQAHLVRISPLQQVETVIGRLDVPECSADVSSLIQWQWGWGEERFVTKRVSSGPNGSYAAKHRASS